ncbi:hypothetical protein Hanom_Chr08g00737071 [Helianthus anomalus]
MFPALQKPSPSQIKTSLPSQKVPIRQLPFPSFILIDSQSGLASHIYPIAPLDLFPSLLVPHIFNFFSFYKIHETLPLLHNKPPSVVHHGTAMATQGKSSHEKAKSSGRR